MAPVFFEFDFDFESPPRAVWDELVDWKGHEQWIFSTHVVVHSDPTVVGAEFTAWSGPMPTTRIGQKFSLQDRMRVTELHFDEATETGWCRVDKLGPTLGGWAGFRVAPLTGSDTGPQNSGTRLTWTEDINVRFVPSLLSPVLSRVGIVGFRFFLGRLARKLSQR